MIIEFVSMVEIIGRKYQVKKERQLRSNLSGMSTSCGLKEDEHTERVERRSKKKKERKKERKRKKKYENQVTVVVKPKEEKVPIISVLMKD